MEKFKDGARSRRNFLYFKAGWKRLLSCVHVGVKELIRPISRQRLQEPSSHMTRATYSRCTSMNRTGKIKKEESEVIGNRYELRTHLEYSRSRLSPSCQPSLPPSVLVPATSLVRYPARVRHSIP